ncbi:MAG: hypothetical protein HY811_03805 [Planctomycetes bacterium]|nr:hypothetical protein [Planctomycetota bacterium]
MKKGIVYTYPKEILRKFRDASPEWKLNWLEEVNKLTFRALTDKEKKFREKIRKGMVK